MSGKGYVGCRETALIDRGVRVPEYFLKESRKGVVASKVTSTSRSSIAQMPRLSAVSMRAAQMLPAPKM